MLTSQYLGSRILDVVRNRPRPVQLVGFVLKCCYCRFITVSMLPSSPLKASPCRSLQGVVEAHFLGSTLLELIDL